MELSDRTPRDRETFCYYPFFQVLMTAEGKFKPCSKHGDFITHQGEVLKVGEATVEDAWNSDYMKDLRESFHARERRPGCVECWREQDMGLRPMRMDSFGYKIPDEQVQKPGEPMRVEICASNICNLRCRICMPTASHRWIAEAKQVYGWNETVHFNMVPENVEIIRKWVPNFTEIGFFGGEPLIARENIELMRYCVETGHSKHITLLLNTNGTVYSDEIVELFKQFKHVFLNFSIDDIGARYEYQRNGARWERVVENMRRYIAHGGFTYDSTIEIKICCSVSTFNIFYFPEFFHFMNKEFPGLPVYWNLVYEPWAFSMELLPKAVKDVIKKRLQLFVTTSYQMTESRTKTVQDLITFLDHSLDKDFGEFFRRIEAHDRYRKQSFAETFPEFWKLLEPYRPVSAQPTEHAPPPPASPNPA
jgi:sulfatase maturation enzyme AslB (radical SAM superfamily)